jgi:hypothetical protein
MLSLRGVLQESASHAMHGAGGLSVPTGGRELADPWSHVCGRVCEFALKSFVRVLGDFFPKTRTNKLRQGKRCGIRRAHHMQVHSPSFFQKQKIPGSYRESVSFIGTPSVEQPSHQKHIHIYSHIHTDPKCPAEPWPLSIECRRSRPAALRWRPRPTPPPLPPSPFPG